jgi:translin
MTDARWTEEMEALRQEMALRHEGREEALALCRKVIQSSSRSIRHIHRRDMDGARKALDETRLLVQEMQGALAPYPELAHSNYRSDAEKEYVEGEAVFAMVQGQPLPTTADLGITTTAYLNGLGEASSECRRYVLDLMRAGELSEADRLMERMEDIYDELMTCDYPDGLTGGLRRTCDALRGVLERTRSDQAVTHIQRELIDTIRDAVGRFKA